MVLPAGRGVDEARSTKLGEWTSGVTKLDVDWEATSWNKWFVIRVHRLLGCCGRD